MWTNLRLFCDLYGSYEYLCQPAPTIISKAHILHHKKFKKKKDMTVSCDWVFPHPPQ